MGSSVTDNSTEVILVDSTKLWRVIRSFRVCVNQNFIVTLRDNTLLEHIKISKLRFSPILRALSNSFVRTVVREKKRVCQRNV